MRCPHCAHAEDKVIESRTLAGGGAIRRRRECIACGFRFTSYERIEERTIMVIKRDGRREPFEREKIERGVRLALDKRPVAETAIENLVDEIDDGAAMLARETNEVESQAIGNMVLERLMGLDKAAYIRFAAVYQNFEDLDDFMRVIRKIKRVKGDGNKGA
jgi:transcriptional repressor NrdR